jgi:hypothetical protein
MASFNITPVEKGIMRCRHTGAFTHEEIQALASFLNEYRGKLLIDLRDASVEECERHIRNFRPMMPTAAIFGAAIDPAVLDIPEMWYAKDVRLFETEGEALAWLREQ